MHGKQAGLLISSCSEPQTLNPKSEADMPADGGAQSYVSPVPRSYCPNSSEQHAIWSVSKSLLSQELVRRIAAVCERQTVIASLNHRSAASQQHSPEGGEECMLMQNS